MGKVCLHSLAWDNQSSSSWLQHSHKHQCKCGHWQRMAILVYKENQMIQNMLILFCQIFIKMKNTVLKYPPRKQVIPSRQDYEFQALVHTPVRKVPCCDKVSCPVLTSPYLVPCTLCPISSLLYPTVLMTLPTMYIPLGHLVSALPPLKP